MSNTFNIKRTATNGDGVALYSVAHPRPTSKIDVIINALSVAQNSVWSALNQEALAYAVELKLELAKPEMPTKIFGPNLEQILNAAGFYRREWVGLTDDEINNFDKKLRDNGDYCSLHFAWGISAKLKEKNNAV